MDSVLQYIYFTLADILEFSYGLCVTINLNNFTRHIGVFLWTLCYNTFTLLYQTYLNVLMDAMTVANMQHALSCQVSTSVSVTEDTKEMVILVKVRYAHCLFYHGSKRDI